MDYYSIFLKDLDFSFALEILFRTFIMFILVLVTLRASGKKGVRQLSIFEVAIIISLGSAAGDPMFNDTQPIIPAILVFITVVLIYRLITWIAARSEKFEDILEGTPIYIIENGSFAMIDGSERTYAKDEFFSELRQQNVEHLGQVKTAVLETNGTISFMFFPDDEVRPGLPVWPKVYAHKTRNVENPGQYACTFCGNVEQVDEAEHKCSRCKNTEWVAPLDTIRIS